MLPVRLLIIEQNAFMMNRILQVLSYEADQDIEILAAFPSVEEANEQNWAEAPPDIVLVDFDSFRSPAMGGLLDVSRVAGRPKLIVLTVSSDKRYRDQALGGHADGWLPKEAIDRHLAKTIRSLL